MGVYMMIDSINYSLIIITGDFNFRGINWTSETACSNIYEMFLQCTKDNFLHQRVCESTLDKYINDLLLTTDESLVHDICLNGMSNDWLCICNVEGNS